MSREKKFTPGPWTTCHKGKCKCKQVWSIPADHPVSKVEAGEWGDTYPAIKDGKAVLESIPYGEISEEVAVANANLIAAAPLMNLLLAFICDSGYSECSPLIKQLSRKVMEVADGKEDMQTVWGEIQSSSQGE